MDKSFESHSSSCLRASYNSFLNANNLDIQKSVSPCASFSEFHKDSLSIYSENMERELDNIMLQSFQEQDIYASVFNFDIDDVPNSNELLSSTEFETIVQAIHNYSNKVQIFIGNLKLFKKDFLEPLLKLRFSPSSQHSFLFSLLPRDTSQLLDLESLLFVELTNLEFTDYIHNLSLAFKNWSQRTKHYGTTNQHSILFKEILRKEASTNPSLKALLESPLDSGELPLDILVEIEHRLEFHQTEIQFLVDIIPKQHPEHGILLKFSDGLSQLLNEYLNSGSNSDSSFTNSAKLLPGRCLSDSPSVLSLNQNFPVKKEVNDKRLEPLNELILTEESYLKDLTLIDEVFAEKIKDMCMWEKICPELVINNLFYNYKTLIEISQQFLERLHGRKLIDPSLSKIGDIILEFSESLPAYGDYGSHAQFSMRFWVNERLNKSKIANCIQAAEQDKRLDKKAINTFLARPTYRLGQYPLLLRQILKYTPTDSQESIDILEALVKIESCLGVLDDLTNKEEKRLQLRKLQDRMFYKSGNINKFGLADEGREIIYEGNLSKPPFGQKLRVFIFDHALLITKPRKIKFTNLNEYDLIKKPIPLDELFLEGASGFLKFAQPKSRCDVTFTIVQVNKQKFDKISVFAASLTEKDIWIEKINSQREKFLAQKGLAKLKTKG